jgi:hypothetical protein
VVCYVQKGDNLIFCITGVIKSRRIGRAVYVARMGGMRNVYNILVDKSEGKRPL